MMSVDYNALVTHCGDCLPVTCLIHVCQAVLQENHVETCLEKVLAGVPDAIFSGDSADIHVLGLQHCGYLAERLSGGIAPVETRILLHGPVTALVECEVLVGVRLQFIGDFPAPGPCNAMRGPDSSLLPE